jgi:hypothetical protein
MVYLTAIVTKGCNQLREVRKLNFSVEFLFYNYQYVTMDFGTFKIGSNYYAQPDDI